MTVVYLKKSFREKEECLSSEIIPWSYLCVGPGCVLFHKHSQISFIGAADGERGKVGERTTKSIRLPSH